MKNVRKFLLKFKKFEALIISRSEDLVAIDDYHAGMSVTDITFYTYKVLVYFSNTLDDDTHTLELDTYQLGLNSREWQQHTSLHQIK